ncbi:MAG: hypothetical protein H0V67_11435, partial [Geodermatophilaceae bacterium]|nr:hypothetical protein [Geodermatophilaceae bacterium]
MDRIRDEARGRQLKLGPKGRPLGEAADQWYQQRCISRPATTTGGNQSALNALRRFAAADRESGRKGDQLHTDRLTRVFLQRFFDSLAADGYAGNTLASYRQGISAFLRWLGYGNKNGALVVELNKRPHE